LEPQRLKTHYKLGYIAGLDGVRAVGMFSVLVAHMGLFPGGVIVMDIFFVLSGFLITGLLLAEHDRKGKISIRDFYVGRAYRLLPAFFAYVAVGAVLVLALKGPEQRQEFFENALSSLLYVNNYYCVDHVPCGASWFGHTWSLSLEEQFYLLWPPVLILLWRRESWRKHLTLYLMGGALLVLVWRLVLIWWGASTMRLYYGLDTRADSLLIGCALGMWKHQKFRRRDEPAPPVVDLLVKFTPLATAALVYLCTVAPELEKDITWLDRGGFTVLGLLSAVLVLGADRAPNSLLIRALSLPWVTACGRVSYAVYLWHFPVTMVAGLALMQRLGTVGGVLAATAISLVLAWLSLVLVERPAQKLRARRLQRRRDLAAAAAASAASAADG
jgi:peptidoglycan/LPS O-acetylase OafA/YrhL